MVARPLDIHTGSVWAQTTHPPPRGKSQYPGTLLDRSHLEQLKGNFTPPPFFSDLRGTFLSPDLELQGNLGHASADTRRGRLAWEPRAGSA